MKALVLSGGGSKGAYELGVLQYLLAQQPDLNYDIFCGNSVGAINSAGLLKFPDLRQSFDWIKNVWLEQIDKHSVYSFRTILNLLKFRWTRPIYNSKPLHDLIKKNISSDDVRNSKKHLAVGAACLDTGEFYYATERDDNIQDWIIASASYPMFMEAVDINGQLWADGQLKHVTPMRQAIKMGAIELDIILTSNFDDHPWNSSAKTHIPDQFIRIIDLMSSEIMLSDIKFLELKNAMVAAGITSMNGVEYRKIKARIIMPKTELIQNALNFDRQEIKRMFDIGADINNSVVINI